MKILHINKDYGDNGGTEQYLYNLCEALENQGHQTSVIYGNRGETVWHLPGRSEYFVPNIHEFSHRDNQETLRACLEIIEKEKPDVINLHLVFNPGLIDLIRTEWPLVRSVHSPHSYCLRYKLFETTDSVCDNRLDYHCLLNAYFKRCADPRPWNLIKSWQKCRQELESNQKVNQIVVFSDYMKDCLLQNKLRHNQVSVLPYFTNIQTQTDPNKRSAENIILYVGRVTKEKGLDYLLRAVRQISTDYKLVVVGDGWYLKNIKSLAHRMGLTDRVEFPGWTSHKNLSSYYLDCSMLVIPSIWPEPFGIVGLEAMSHAKPVIAFNVGGISNWLESGETGFLIEPKDVKEMTAKIELLLEKKELAIRMGETGQQKVAKDFGASTHIQNLISIYQQSIEETEHDAKTHQMHLM